MADDPYAGSTLVGEMVAALVYLTAGSRVWRLGARAGGTPERLLGLSFLLWGLGYVAYGVPYLWVDESELAAFAVLSRSAVHAGTLSFTLFTWKVFRPGDAWARWLVAGIGVSVVLGLAGSVWVKDWDGSRPLSNPFYWLELLGTLAPFVWMALDGFRQYAHARRRRRVGLCDPLVCNRFLLWGLAGVLWVLLVLVFIPLDVGYELTWTWNYSLGLVGASFEIVPVTLILLVLFPPAFYRRWIQGGAARLERAAQP